MKIRLCVQRRLLITTYSVGCVCPCILIEIYSSSLGLRVEDEVSRGRGQSGQGVYTGHSNICLLGVILPRVYLLPRKVKYTRVYTTVYLRVYNCVHACTQPRSRYVPDRALLYADLPRLTLGAPEIHLRLPWI